MPKKKAFPPDWREESAYPDPDKTSSDRWAWEFLRGNTGYRNDYKILIKASKPEWSEQKSNGYGFGGNACDPAPLPNENYDDYHIRMKKKGTPSIRSEPLGQYLATKWKIYKLIDPFENSVEFSQPDFVRAVGFAEDFCEPEVASFQFLFENENEMFLSFDLRQPTKILLNEAKKILDEYKKDLKNKEKGRRKRKDVYPTYLRLLDAEDAGATIKEMGEVIFPDLPNQHPDYNRNQRVHDSLAKARQLRDSPQFLTYFQKPKK
jgi:hypothetical protein